MSDIVDRANDHAAMLLRQALEDQRRRAGLDEYSNGAPRDWRAISAAVCEAPHCGEPIPDDRRRAVPGVRLCTACQERIERGYRA